MINWLWLWELANNIPYSLLYFQDSWEDLFVDRLLDEHISRAIHSDHVSRPV